MFGKWVVWILLVWICGTSLSLSGQTDRLRSAADLDYIQQALIRLDIPGDSTKFHDLFDKIDRIKRGSPEQLQILHIGGSHVQAGAMTERLRQHFSELFTPYRIGERGFLFPYTLADYNNPADYIVNFTGQWKGCRNAYKKHDCTWGLSGITATTHSQVASFKIEPQHYQYGAYRFNKCRIYYDLEHTSYAVDVINWDCPTDVIKDTVLGYVEWTFEADQRAIEFLISKTDFSDSTQQFSLEGVQFMTSEPGAVVHGIGVNGAKVSSFLRCTKLQQQLCLIQPDLIIFGIGLNDIYMRSGRFKPDEFRDNYEALIDIVNSCDQSPALLFLTNNDHYVHKRYANKNNFKSNVVFYDLARKYNGAVFDLFNVMGGINSIKNWRDDELAKSDLIHFKTKGYHLIADMIFDAFDDQYIKFALQNQTSK